MTKTLACIFFALIAAAPIAAEDAKPRPAGVPKTEETSPGRLPGSPIELPALGYWLLDEQGLPTHWLGKKLNGKTIFEPINLIIYDPYSESAAAAVAKVLSECRRDGYEEELGHSSIYWGLIGGELYPQLHYKKRMAFSDKDFFQTNNHGRIIGPARWKDGWLFVAGFSREYFQVFNSVHHVFASFSQARDDFSQKLCGRGVFRSAGRVRLDNLKNDAAETTGDHDGCAVFLQAEH